MVTRKQKQKEGEEILTPDEVAKIVGLKVGTLKAMRACSSGPTYCRIGHRTIRYLKSDVMDWVDGRRVKMRFPH